MSEQAKKVRRIYLRLEGGLVQACWSPDGKFDDIEVRVRDYDVDGEEPRFLRTDPEGYEYRLSEWRVFPTKEPFGEDEDDVDPESDDDDDGDDDEE